MATTHVLAPALVARSDSARAVEIASPRLVRPEVVRWVRAYGNSVSAALFDPRCTHYSLPNVDGALAYKIGWGCAIAIGDPVCPPADRMTLARAFERAARDRGLPTVFAVVSESFAREMTADGAAALAFGKDLGVDPRRDPSAGSKGRELRKKLIHARKAGLTAGEYDRARFGSFVLERELERVADEWRVNRRGPQVYVTGIRLFEAPDVTRYFYVRHGDRYVGVLATLRLDARDGYVLQHVLVTPDAPDGTSELLVTHTLATLGNEGCAFATFGPAPDRELGHIVNLSPWSERIARAVFDAGGKAFHLDSRTRYRRKFQIAYEEGSYLVFAPAKVGVRQVGALSTAFNVSLG